MTEKFDRNAQLADARAALAATGMSPRELAHENRADILHWLFRWGISSVSILNSVLEKNAGRIVNRLVDRGWLHSTKTQSGIPASFVTLTELGLAEATRHAEKQVPYPELDPSRVKQHLLRHNLLVQRLTSDAWDLEEISGFETEREISTAGDKPGIKRPDAVWFTKDGRAAIEVELSGKWERDLDQFILGIVMALIETENRPRRFDRFIIFSDTPAILKRYKTAMSAGSSLNIWKKNTRGRWYVDETKSVPAWLLQRVEFRAIKD